MEQKLESWDSTDLVNLLCLKIIAGLDDQFQGEVVFSPGYSVGMLEQEPKMDPELRVIDVIKEGVKEVTSLLEEYDQINLKFGRIRDFR